MMWKHANIILLQTPITTNADSVLFYVWIIKQGSKIYKACALSSDHCCRSLFPHTHSACALGRKKSVSKELYITY